VSLGVDEQPAIDVPAGRGPALSQDVPRRPRQALHPADPELLVLLPGVGRYTAGAVASFAYERATPAIDTNVARVIKRAFHPRLAARGAERRLWATGAAIMPQRGGRSAWTFNQAIMELGALICTARVARCGECPVRAVCATGRRALGR
jgi:A/G-specific adenine glycosylase